MSFIKYFLLFIGTFHFCSSKAQVPIDSWMIGGGTGVAIAKTPDVGLKFLPLSFVQFRVGKMYGNEFLIGGEFQKESNVVLGGLLFRAYMKKTFLESSFQIGTINNGSDSKPSFAVFKPVLGTTIPITDRFGVEPSIQIPIALGKRLFGQRGGVVILSVSLVGYLG